VRHRRFVVELRSFAPRLLLFQGSLVGVFVGLEAPLLGDDLRQIEGESVRVVEAKGGVAADDGSSRGPHPRDLFLQYLEPAIEGLAEAHFLRARDAGDELLAAFELRIRGPHRAHDFERHFVEEGLANAEAMSVSNRPPHHAPQDVFTPDAIGKDAFRDEKCGRARVVGDDAHRYIVVGL
jgi:hypothetical protein